MSATIGGMLKVLSKISQKRWIVSISILAVVILAVGGSLWHSKIYFSPERRFWAAIDNGLKTSSVTKEVVREDPNSRQIQRNRYRLGADFSNQGQTLVTEKAVGGSSSTVATSTLATEDTSFVRYDKIETAEKNQNGQAFDFSNVTGLWAAQDDQSTQTSSKAQNLAESFIQLVPFGNLNGTDRAQIIRELKDQKAYDVNFDDVNDNDETGFTVYNVTLNTKAYVTILRDIFAKQGLPTLSALDPEQYDVGASIGLQISIDGSNIVRRIGFNGTEDYESYDAYGVTERITVPKNPLSAGELNSRLQAIQ